MLIVKASESWVGEDVGTTPPWAVAEAAAHIHTHTHPLRILPHSYTTCHMMWSSLLRLAGDVPQEGCGDGCAARRVGTIAC